VSEKRASTRIGRYTLYDVVATGGMAKVHIGRMESAAGVTRTVAVKRVHPHFATDPDFASMFFDEARLSLRIQHPNVVPTFDVVAEDGELLLVMDYIHGDVLSSLLRQAQKEGSAVPPRIASGIIGGVLAGLHAAHQLHGEDGLPLGIVHRDVSPQNVIVGLDGVARVLDFGVAKAAGRLHTTEQGKVKGKIAYMAPEQLVSGPLDRRADVFATAVILWEVLTGQRLFSADGPGAAAIAVLTSEIRLPSTVNPRLDPAVDRVVMSGLSRNVESRYASAEAMAIDLEHVLPPAPPRAISEWVSRLARDKLQSRSQAIAEVESDVGPMRALARSSAELARSGANEVPSELMGSMPVVLPEQTATLASSTITTDAGAPALPKPRGPRLLAAAVGALGVGVVALAIRLATGGTATAAPDAASVPVPSAVQATAQVPQAQPADASDRPSDASAATVTQPPPAKPRPTPAPFRPTPPRTATPPPRPPDCANPFVVNNGIRVPRPECFRSR